jgi:hypothetical protein
LKNPADAAHSAWRWTRSIFRHRRHDDHRTNQARHRMKDEGHDAHDEGGLPQASTVEFAGFAHMVGARCGPPLPREFPP